MKNEIVIFKNDEFGSVRTIEVNGEPYFVGKDVAEILGYSDPQKALKMHVDDDDKLTRQIVVSGQNRNMYIINESGLYSLILSSKLPSAKRFKRWVTSEVLPAIRKTGSYILQEKVDSYLIENPAERARRWAEEYEEKAALETKIKQDEPLVDFANRVSNASNTIDIGMLAKLLNEENIPIGRNRLFEWLRKNKFLRKNNEPYQKYIDNGVFDYIEYTYNTAYGEKTGGKTVVTGKGQIYITEKLRKFYNKSKICLAESGDKDVH